VVGITSMNLIDVPSIVANIMTAESMRGTRLIEQKTTQDAQIVAYQALNVSMASVLSAAESITGSVSWVPTSTGVAFSDVADTGLVSAYSTAGAVPGASPYAFSVTSIVGGGSATATISYPKGGATVRETSSSNTFSGLTDFPGLTISVSGVTAGTVTLTPAATTATASSVMTTAASNLVTALNNMLNLIKVETAASGALDTDYTPREVSQTLLSTAYDSYTFASLSDAGIEMTKVGSFTFDEAKLSAALAGGSASELIGQVAAFAARVEAVATAATSVTGSISREISTRQTRVTDLTQQITDMTEALALREDSLTVFYSDLNAKIQALQTQKSFLQTTFDVFVKALTSS
jgi:flagellar capping protein FliD